MKYIIKNVGQSRQYQYNGTQLISYSIMINDKGQDIWCDLSQKTDKPAPIVNTEIDGEIKYSQNPQYAHKFKKTMQTFSGGGYKSNPETQASIIRQNALTNAVAYWTVKNPIEMTIQDIIETAKLFSDYSSGKSEVQSNPPVTKPVSTPQTNTIYPNNVPVSDPNINLEDIPF